MRQSLMVSEIVPASRETVWAVLSPGDRVERWFPFVERTEVHQSSESGSRTIHLPDGRRFDEYITLNDAGLYVYQYYAPAPPLPFRHVIGTHRLRQVAEGTLVTWAVSYEPLDPEDLGFTAGLPARYRAALHLLSRGLPPAPP